MSAPADVELIDVQKRFGSVVAVDRVSLAIPAGTYACLLGPSGCGKTTTLRMIAGHEQVTSGDITIGKDSVISLPPARRGTAMMFQNYALFPHLNCLENVAFSLKMQRVSKAVRHEQALSFLRLVQMEDYAKRLPAQLSGGQQQRIALARALVTKPGVLLLDEPSPLWIHSCGCRCESSSNVCRPNSASRLSTSRTAKKKRWHWPIWWW